MILASNTEESVYLSAAMHHLKGIRILFEGFLRFIERLAIPDTAVIRQSLHQGVRSVETRDFTIYGGISQPDPLSETLTGNSCLSVNIKLD